MEDVAGEAGAADRAAGHRSLQAAVRTDQDAGSVAVAAPVPDDPPT